ncbi:5549_t:CDS:2 [Funneliformis geosporum]|uniref:5549_t:CDS:1 n=1 Tax=Funneliformis geosporum TaxID=1117311 RepID=A0A9W4SC67_9GLOM|nr:5549_t:CDS:2 [Funneliformis geosporum]
MVFGRIDTRVSEIKGVRVSYDSDLLFILLGFKLDPNFIFKANFAYRRRANFVLIEHPFSNTTEEVKQFFKGLIDGIKNKENLEEICQSIENSQFYKDYKKKLNDGQLIELSTKAQQLEIELLTERVNNANLQQEVVQLQNELKIGREKTAETIKKLKKRIEKLEVEKTENINLEKEHLFYKDIYCEASQETEQISFVKKQLNRAKENLKEKLSEKELELILEKQTKITELENKLNSLRIQEVQGSQIEIPPK